MSRIVDLAIESIAAGGDGVGRADGLVVFVPRSAPGDEGRVRIAEGGRFARGEWESLDRPSVLRTEPSCAHYLADRCGGCQLQHVGYETQLDAKATIIRDAIQRIGRRDALHPRVRPSPRQWRYRRKLTLALRRRGSSPWIAGLHPYDAPGRVFDLRDCPITDERVLAVWSEIRAASRWLPETRELRGAVRVADGDAGATASFLVEGGERWPTHARFFDAVPSLASLWWRPENQGRRLLHARTAVAAAPGAPGPAHVPDAADADAHLADASFAQVNDEVAAELREHVVALALAHQPTRLVDAYAGRGDTAVALAESGAIVTAIEFDRDAAARGAARLSPPSRMIRGRVEDEIDRALPADVVIVNPPRAGLDAQVTARLASATDMLRAVIYVSCNPATLARDLGRLPAFRIASLLAFDMFPQTAHVETVCELVRADE